MTSVKHPPSLNDGKTVVNNLRRALAQMLAGVGADVEEPQEISRRFGVDKTLAWRIARAIREDDPWASLQHLPTRHGIGIFVSAMNKHGATPEAVAALWERVAAFEQFVEAHARDRETLEMMVNVGPRRSSEKRMEAFRKAGFQSNCALLGVRAAAQIKANFVAPSATPGMVDVATLSGLVDFCRLRPEVSWAVASIRNWGGKPGELPGQSPGIEAISGSIVDPQSCLIPDFCSQPLPEIRIDENPEGMLRYLLAEGPIGYSVAATVMTGWLYRSTASTREAYPGEIGEHGAYLTTPAEVLVADLFVHRDLAFALNVKVRVYSQFPGGPRYPDKGSEAALLPVPCDVVDLGVGPPDAPVAEFPRYQELARRVADRMKHAISDFHVFRYRLRYPPIPSLALLSHPLQPE